jgi:hypothetical protein
MYVKSYQLISENAISMTAYQWLANVASAIQCVAMAMANG